MQFVHETHSERTQKKSGGDPRNRPVRVVCAGCNGGWMSRLQQTAKPLLIPLVTGQAVRLDAQAQQVIAVWCAMSVMTAEFLSHDRQAISLDERRSIKATQSVPADTWKIWIGHYVRGGWQPLWAHTVMPIGDEEISPVGDDGVPIANTQTTSLVVGQLYIHAFSCPYNFLIRAATLPDEARSLSQIWPPTSANIDWPRSTMTDRDADNVAGFISNMIDALSRIQMSRPVKVGL